MIDPCGTQLKVARVLTEASETTSPVQTRQSL